MKLQTILIIWIVVMVLVGGGLFLWFLTMEPYEPSSSSPDAAVPLNGQGSNTFSGGSANTTPVSTPGGSPSTQSPQDGTASSTASAMPVDIDAQFKTLFENLSAEKIAFVPTSPSSAAYASIMAFYSQDIAAAKKAYPQQAVMTLDVASVDLDGDAANEVIVYENLPGFCGTAGCPLTVYKKQGSGWQTILDTVAYENIGIVGPTGGGFRNMLIPVHGDVGYQTKVERWVWSGSEYRPFGTEATWDGSAFLVGQ
jgi:hypothetical protein